VKKKKAKKPMKRKVKKPKMFSELTIKSMSDFYSLVAAFGKCSGWDEV